MNPRKLFVCNLYMITGMLLFYMGGLVLYPSQNITYGILCLGAGLVMFLISMDKIIRSMVMLRNPQQFKSEAEMQKERAQAGHRRGVLERKQKYSFAGFGLLLLTAAFLKLELMWIFLICALFFLLYLWIFSQINQLNHVKKMSQ